MQYTISVHVLNCMVSTSQNDINDKCDNLLPLQRLTIPDDCEPHLADLIKFCWQEPKVDSNLFPFSVCTKMEFKILVIWSNACMCNNPSVSFSQSLLNMLAIITELKSVDIQIKFAVSANCES